MRRIEVKFFGLPSIWIDGQKIEIPQKKVESLFLYLLANEQCTRDELATLFWGDYSETKAKRNLRNTIYKLKQFLGKDIVFIQGNKFISINPDIEIDTDLSLLLKSKNIDTLLDIKEHNFLDKYYVTNCEGLENWIHSMRNTYNNIFLEKYENGLMKYITLRNVKKVEMYASKIIDIDKYNEKAYQALMKLYADKGVYNKAISLYNNLVNMLNKDLGVSPNNQTKALYEKIIKSKRLLGKNFKVENNRVFYGRFNELMAINEEYKKFCQSDSYRYILIRGETGIGKTSLINEFLKEVDPKEFSLLQLNFSKSYKYIYFEALRELITVLSDIADKKRINIDKTYYNSIFDKLLNFDTKSYHSNEKTMKMFNSLMYSSIKVVLSELVERITKKQKVFIVLENIQWMDPMGFRLLSEILLKFHLNNLFFIGTVGKGYERNIEDGITILTKNKKIKMIEMLRFSREEVGEFIGLSIEKLENDLTLADKVFKKTEGNMNLLVEAINILKRNGDINCLSEKNQYMFKSFIMDIDDNEKKILGIISIFDKGVTPDILINMYEDSSDNIIETLDMLMKKHILKEEVSNKEVKIFFILEMLRGYFYTSLSITKRMFLHSKSAKLFENEYLKNRKNCRYLSQLSYHYSNTDNSYKHVYYKIKYLEYRLDYCDEFFPTIKRYNNEYINLFIEKEKVYKTFYDIEELLSTLEYTMEDEKLLELYTVFYYIKGRTLIRDGNYEEGIENIRKLISLSKNMGYKYYIIHGYLEMTYYTIKINDTENMDKYIQELKDFEFIDEFIIEKGIIYRLDGVLNIMLESYETAEELLNKSIEIFESDNNIRNSNFLNVAAAYNYLGDIRRFNRHYESALKFYDKAIEICKKNESIKGLDIFYKNYGQTAFYMEDFKLAKKYFEKSFEIYDLLDSFWERSIAESYMALIHIYNGEYSKGVEYLNRAEIYSKKNASPYELRILSEVKNIIRKKVKNFNEAKFAI